MDDSDNQFWKKELQQYTKFRSKNDPFSFYYPEKKASITVLVNYIHKILNLREARILEAGMGTGLALALITKRGGLATGVDNSEGACLFSKMVKEDYLPKNKYKNLNIINKDFMRWKSEEKFDLVFNIGVIEHFSKKTQIAFLNKMKFFSKEYVLVGIPDYNSPIFRGFINYFHKVDRLNVKKHLKIDVEKLFQEAEISLIDKTGIGIGISSKEIDFDDSALVNFLAETFETEDLRNFSIDHTMIDWLVEKEMGLPKEERDKFAFLDIYLGKV